MLRNTADTLFQAQKHFIWNSHGLTYSPATAVAETHSTTNRIDTALPGLIGRIATQIAAGRVAQVHNQADEIAAQHAADRIEQRLTDLAASMTRFGGVGKHLRASAGSRLFEANNPAQIEFPAANRRVVACFAAQCANTPAAGQDGTSAE